MTAISKSWTAIADAQIDPDSPITQALMTAIRDDLVHVREWLGASYFAGAVQDHNHDGVTSALVEVGPNYQRNGSFESDESGWTFVDFSGGSHAISASGAQHGAKRLTCTSTVLANGGSQALSGSFMPVAGGATYGVSVWVWASVANVSCRVEIVWYDSAQASISASIIQTYTNTPTTASVVTGSAAAPSTARYAKVRLTGGVAATGTAVGTISFDGVTFSHAWDGSYIQSSVIAQGHIKGADGDVNTAVTVTTNQVTLPGGAYSWLPGAQNLGGSTTTADCRQLQTTAGYVYQVILYTSSAANSAYLRSRYIQASPPYNLGNGDVPVFIFADLDGSGVPISTWTAPDPPWANNGPTDIRPNFYAAGKGYKLRKKWRSQIAKLRGTPAQRQEFFALLDASEDELVEVDQAMKQADMPLIPHPFQGGLYGTPVLLDPVGKMAERLASLHGDGEAVSRLIADGYVQVDNVPLAGVAAPPGVTVYRGKWKVT